MAQKAADVEIVGFLWLQSGKDMTKIEVLDASVDFYKYEENSLTYYFFDSSLTTPPDPMVNALLGLQLLDNKNKEKDIYIYFIIKIVENRVRE